MDHLVSRQHSTKKYQKTTDTTRNFDLSTQKKVMMIRLSFSRVGSNLVTYEELSRSAITSTIWFSSMITWQQRTLSGFISEFKTLKGWSPTNSILSISLNPKAPTIKVWSHYSTQGWRLQMLRMEAKAMGGIEMVKTLLTSRTSWRRKEVDSTTLLHSQFSSSMMTTKCSWLIAIHIRTLIALNYFNGFALLIAKTGFAKPSSARRSQEMIAKWLLLPTSAQGLKR